ncbi:hypothetical protein H4Q32_023504 [Labeo rohita]|uniref:Uncharacterized protein n=1 Tax=Labeo rohita TaxID=84645 RepID=A0ABQ8L893_LABRO|nr:hypothetical protein H4Q32_023504 [Labeo rohita]
MCMYLPVTHFLWNILTWYPFLFGTYLPGTLFPLKYTCLFPFGIYLPVIHSPLEHAYMCIYLPVTHFLWNILTWYPFLFETYLPGTLFPLEYTCLFPFGIYLPVIHSPLEHAYMCMYLPVTHFLWNILTWYPFLFGTYLPGTLFPLKYTCLFPFGIYLPVIHSPLEHAYMCMYLPVTHFLWNILTWYPFLFGTYLPGTLFPLKYTCLFPFGIYLPVIHSPLEHAYMCMYLPVTHFLWNILTWYPFLFGTYLPGTLFPLKYTCLFPFGIYLPVIHSPLEHAYMCMYLPVTHFLWNILTWYPFLFGTYLPGTLFPLKYTCLFPFGIYLPVIHSPLEHAYMCMYLPVTHFLWNILTWYPFLFETYLPGTLFPLKYTCLFPFGIYLPVIHSPLEHAYMCVYLPVTHFLWNILTWYPFLFGTYLPGTLFPLKYTCLFPFGIYLPVIHSPLEHAYMCMYLPVTHFLWNILTWYPFLFETYLPGTLFPLEYTCLFPFGIYLPVIHSPLEHAYMCVYLPVTHFLWNILTWYPFLFGTYLPGTLFPLKYTCLFPFGIYLPVIHSPLEHAYMCMYLPVTHFLWNILTWYPFLFGTYLPGTLFPLEYTCLFPFGIYLPVIHSPLEHAYTCMYLPGTLFPLEYTYLLPVSIWNILTCYPFPLEYT